MPAVKRFDNYDQEARYIAHIFRRVHDEQAVPWSDMCVLYRSAWMGERLKAAFAGESIPCQWLNTPKAKKQLKIADDSIKLMTMHSGKGLEFPVVAVSGVGRMPVDKAEVLGEAKLLYVAMTRATERLLITADRDAEFTSELQKSAADEKGA